MVLTSTRQLLLCFCEIFSSPENCFSVSVWWWVTLTFPPIKTIFNPVTSEFVKISTSGPLQSLRGDESVLFDVCAFTAAVSISHRYPLLWKSPRQRTHTGGRRGSVSWLNWICFSARPSSSSSSSREIWLMTGRLCLVRKLHSPTKRVLPF